MALAHVVIFLGHGTGAVAGGLLGAAAPGLLLAGSVCRKFAIWDAPEVGEGIGTA